MYVVDEQGRVANWNEAGGRLRPAVTALAGLEALYEPEEAADGTPARELATAREQGRCVTEARLRLADGRDIAVRRTVERLRHGGGYWVCLTTEEEEVIPKEDVRALGLDGEHLRRQVEELERCNAELLQFSYAASHDLQEPLRAVSSAIQMLEKQCGSEVDATGRELMGFALDGVERMNRLVRDLLTYSRVVSAPEPELRETDLNGVLAWALANLKPAMEAAGAEVTQERLPRVEADAAQLSQVFEQLAGNALKFGGENGAPRIHVWAVEEPEAWRICVRDNGCGIDPQYAERIFRAFQRLHGRGYPGSGVGLAICRTIVERHGGRIWVESQPGAGATFCFTIPK